MLSRILPALIISAAIAQTTHAEDYVNAALENVYTGQLLVNYHNGAGYVFTYPAYEYTGSDFERINWRTEYLTDGSLRFRNAYYTDVCLHVDSDYSGVYTQACDNSDHQRFTPIYTSTGAVQLQNRSNSNCLYVDSGSSNSSVYHKSCSTGSIDASELWVITVPRGAAKSLPTQ
ncbi:ricin-type beta-trefoil lectin domain protein [Hahella sp. HN01]|uniref:ricin-type beta-trefoil lectin domain protein n=1 Tax=Hahella sp. HN01 TaxID=2847262 RepID=UPI001C1EA58C|nr:ricin-type beta-trefoil lectin domain protein [Hahella sp. HN01]MBU6951247.1 ricin-type beta-trefoil lectin domain protein [Hahella sp. HN01]